MKFNARRVRILPTPSFLVLALCLTLNVFGEVEAAGRQELVFQGEVDSAGSRGPVGRGVDWVVGGDVGKGCGAGNHRCRGATERAEG